MPEGIITALSLAIVAGFCNGSFFLPQRYVRGWPWENMWVVFATGSQIVLPWAVAWYVVPDLGRVLRSSPLEFFLPATIAGLVWGSGMVTYGLGVNMVGIAVGNAIVASMSTTAGTLGPLIVYAPEKILTPVGAIFVVAIALIVGGIYVYGRAGAKREAATAQSHAGERSEFRAGMIVCLATGVLGTAFIYGFASSHALVNAALNTGTKPSVANYLPFAVTFSAGFIPNLGYALFRMLKNRSAGAYAQGGHFAINTALAILMGVIWYAGVLMYGVAAGKLGRLGPSVGFGLFVSGTVLFANLLGWLAGEWRGASAEVIRGFVKGMALVVAGIAVIAVGVAQSG